MIKAELILVDDGGANIAQVEFVCVPVLGHKIEWCFGPDDGIRSYVVSEIIHTPLDSVINIRIVCDLERR